MIVPIASTLLAARGPITGLAVLVSVATFAAGSFFVTLGNLALDCATGSATAAGCTVDVLETVVAAVVATGAIGGATAIGLTSPTPRDGSLPIFRVDGEDVDWFYHANHQQHGLNRTIDNPAKIEWQLNHTTPVTTYITYQKDGYLIKRHDTGFDIPDPKNKRGLCRAYYDTHLYTDDLRSYEFHSTPQFADYAYISESLFYQFANAKWDAGCVWLKGNQERDGTFEASFELGASCDNYEPHYLNCGSAGYGDQLIYVNMK